MAAEVLGVNSSRGGRAWRLLVVLALVLVGTLILTHSSGHATSGGSPYDIPAAEDTNPDPNVFETTISSENATVDIGGRTAKAQTFNGSIPGPTIRLKVGDTVIVHYENNLNESSSIHWHGIELSNAMDGTPFTQNPVPAGKTFLYKFTVTRPGIYWYHPHNHTSTNQVFHGLYGMIIVDDPNEAALKSSGTLPSAAQTRPLVLSDMTVCKSTNDAATYDPSLPWVGGGALPVQATPTPKGLCETGALDEDGNPRGPFAAGEIPNIQTSATNGRTNEGQTVLTNGVNPGGRAGSPSAPGALAAGASTLDVQPGQGLRLQLLNAATIRFFRLRLTDNNGTQIPLVRIGGEGGLIDKAVVEGGQPGGFDTGYDSGEILIDPGSRADVVAAIPASATGTLTLWTEDYSRTGQGFSDVPTVPVMHLHVTGSTVSPAYTIAAGTDLRAATGDPVPTLGAATAPLADPGTFSPVKKGKAAQDIQLTQTGSALGVDGTIGTHDSPGVDYTTVEHLDSTRYARIGDTLQLSVTNKTSAHHPYHLHGFSMQPISLTKSGSPTYTWPYKEFRDTIDIPPQYSLNFRVKLADRPLADASTPGGVLGRWVFHCHIFFHAENGMLGELVVLPQGGNEEKPDVNSDDGVVEVAQGATATMHGTYNGLDGGAVTLTASVGSVSDDGGGKWTWTYPTGSGDSRIVYITATNAEGDKDQAAFQLKIKNTPPTLNLPGDQTEEFHHNLSFGISATDPDAGDTVSLSATGLPDGLTFTDNGDRTGTVSGKITADPGTYVVTFSADDHHHPPVTGQVKIIVTKEHTKLTYTGATTSPYHHPFTASGKLVDPANNDPIVGQTVSFELGSGDTCSGTTNGSGVVSCQITPTQVPGPYTITGTFAGGIDYLASTDSKAFTITKEATTLTYDGPGQVANDFPATLKGTLKEDIGTPIAGRTVTFMLGTGSSTQTCQGVTDASGQAQCTIASVAQPASATMVSAGAAFAGDAYYLPSSQTKTIKLLYYTGRAFGLRATVLGLGPVTLSDTGAIQTSVRSQTQRSTLFGVFPLGSFNAMGANVTTGLGTSSATATVSSLNIGGILPIVQASGVNASSQSTCAAATGSTTITSLSVAGIVRFNGSPAPNTTLKVLGLTITLNEQTPVAGADHGLLVNAIHIHYPLGNDVVVSSAQSDIHNCL